MERVMDVHTRLQRMIVGDEPDVYADHRERLNAEWWDGRSHLGESGGGELHHVDGVGVSAPEPEPLRTFLPDIGEDLELTPEELRAWRDARKRGLS